MANRKKTTAPAPDYIAALGEIRRIAEGQNDRRRPMTWREAVETWERTHGADDKARAAFMVRIGIATTGECKLLDGVEDCP